VRTELLIPDNTKTGVSKACRYEPDLNPTYQEMAMHYGFAGKYRVVIPQQLRSSSLGTTRPPHDSGDLDQKTN
jgi:hypothetical protein